jgi:methionine-rich copper-binding protein CopC
MMKIKSKGFLVTSFLLSILITSVCSANAHSSLINSDPSSGQILDRISQVMTLTFNEDLIEIEGEQVNSLQLNFLDSGEKTALELNVIGPEISGLLPARTYPAGKYELSYRVVSADGHPITGVIPFSSSEITTVMQPEPKAAISEAPIANSPSQEDVASGRDVQLLYLVTVLIAGGIFLLRQNKRRKEK